MATNNENKKDAVKEELKNVPEVPGEDAKEEEHKDSLIFDDSVVEKIISLAAREIKGVLDLKGGFISGITESFGASDATKGVDATINDKDVILDVKMILEFGQSAPRIFEELKQYAEQQLKLMTGLNIVELNVEVVDVMTRKDFEEKKQKNRASQNNPNVGAANPNYRQW
ncbi:MAG: Asp23/Gls24 family envelope stress response protein [Peptoniphilus sp.]|nr:Asp23/Gls24 family envelope stress response protein [Peptoniphilus sp.]MDD7362535.1 Asp23/Gls24 family envelope stress response protein [Bacillota bacterium]MDY6045066.1 Asp23/Gls24 family envelope stress response protein [Peptoniphilus sp.]